MSPFLASATVVNLLLATGPFTYPYAYVSLGPVISAPLLFITAIFAHVSATYIVEACSIAQIYKPEKDSKERSESVFAEETYESAEKREAINAKDLSMKDSTFYIREKMEIGVIADRISAPWFKYFIISILIIYVYGALSLKYVTGAESLYQGISYIIYDSEGTLETNDPWIYYVSIAIFGGLAIMFSFGDIEHSKTLQNVTAVLRVVVIFCMYGGTIYYWVDDGTHKAKTFDFKNHIGSLATVLGNTVFTFIYHHSVPGIIYPVRP